MAKKPKRKPVKHPKPDKIYTDCVALHGCKVTTSEKQ